MAGYQVGGKTGTSEDGVNTGKYVTSFIGVANTDDPEVAILITLYNPTGEGGHQGGSVAAPVAGAILKEVLPYLDLKKEEEEKNEIIMENVKDLPIKEVKEKLQYFEIEIIGENLNSESKIYKQIPEEGVKINSGGKVILYAE
ncbi:MAG: penicillin-binding transpeptidase domain-containing protein [Candidatus Scatovivens sp.]